MEEGFQILAIKPEFQQTKIGIYDDEGLVFLKSVIHNNEDLIQFKENTDQFEYRGKAILREIVKAGIDLSSIRIIMARGGLIKPIASGIYEVNDAMKHDLRHSPVGRHSVNLGGLIADYLLSKMPNAKAYIADPAVVDELDDIARITGFPDIQRRSIFHALNHKYVCRQYAKSVRKPYQSLNLIVAHLGEGISIGAHKNGRVIDVNQCFDGEGPFSLERAGTIPMVDLVKISYSGKYTEDELLTILRNHGGMFAYLGTNSHYELEKAEKINNQRILQLFEAMAYHVSKYIGSMAPVFAEPVDAIILTGILAHSCWFTSIINERVKFIAPVNIFPGEDVLDALAMNANMLLKGEAKAMEYV